MWVIGRNTEGEQEIDLRDGRRKGRNGKEKKRAFRREEEEEEEKKKKRRVRACVPSNRVCRAEAVMNDLGGAESPREESLLSASMKRKSS